MLDRTLRAIGMRALVAVCCAATVAPAQQAVSARAGSLFNPRAFGATAALSVPSSGDVVFDTDALTVTGTVSGVGVKGLPASGTNEVAVFAFRSVSLADGAKVAVRGRRALALVSEGPITINTALDVSGGPGGLKANDPAAGGMPGPGGWWGGMPAKDRGGPGQGPGAGANYRVKGAAAGGGGGYGGDGGETTFCDGKAEVRMAGGKAYGDAALTELVGGSGGAGGSNDRQMNTQGGGGGGGGALALISATSIVIGPRGSVTAAGGAGSDRVCGGGGGSGGAILLAAPTLALQGAVSVAGGKGGAGASSADNRPGGGRRNDGHGGGGGGGRVAIYSNTHFGSVGKDKEEKALPKTVVLGGGEAGGPGAGAGMAGTVYGGRWSALR